jgi:ATP-dependent helicase/nuclease subunit B
VPVERFFLGWDASLIDRAREYFLPEAPVAPVDLSDTLILVPTRQAGRRLREALARFCSDADTALLSVRAAPPSILFASDHYRNRPAPGVVVKALWSDALLKMDAAALEGFCTGEVTDVAWALRTGEMLQQLRESLAEGGCRMADVVAHMEEDIREEERWQAMARMEEAYLEGIAHAGFEDPFEARIRVAAKPQLPDGVTRIVVAGVPDLTRLAVQALEVLASTCRIEILIHAPDDLAQGFDPWGRPDESFWSEVPIDIPEPDRNLILAATPSDQARRVVDVIASEQEHMGPGDVGVGVPDGEVSPCVMELLSAHGVATFDPAEHAVSEHPLVYVLSLYVDFVTDGSYAAVSHLLRSSDVLTYLEREHELRATDLLRQLDRFQNETLPGTLADMGATLAARGTETFAVLAKAIEILADWRSASGATARIQDAVRDFLAELYCGRTVTPRVPEDALFCTVAEIIDAVLHEFDELPSMRHLSSREALHLLLQRLSEETHQPQRPGDALELEGWLELPWNDAALMIVTGMNEGMVPDGRIGDAFLPDTLRAKLGLRHDRRRLARDAFMMRALIESRAMGGRTCFIAGKTSANGDPLKPSRLLFRCPDNELAARARSLFGPVTHARPDCPRSVAFTLQPVIADEAVAQRVAKRELSVTTFRSYLTCPFRFYLRHQLRMEQVADDKQGLDALDFGTLLHSVLQDMVTDDMWRCEDVAQLTLYLQESADRRMHRRYGGELSLPLLVTLDAARQRLAAVAVTQVALVREGWDVEVAEQRLDMSLAGFRVRGTIDRVDRHRETGRLRVIDYKTSDRSVSPKAAHLASAGTESRAYARVDSTGRPQRWIDLQLPLYRLLLAASRGEDTTPEMAYFNIPKAATLTGVECWSAFSETLMASACECAEGVLGDIAAGVFWPPADRVKYDDFAALLLDDPKATIDPGDLVAAEGGP